MKHVKRLLRVLVARQAGMACLHACAGPSAEGVFRRARMFCFFCFRVLPRLARPSARLPRQSLPMNIPMHVDGRQVESRPRGQKDMRSGAAVRRAQSATTSHAWSVP